MAVCRHANGTIGHERGMAFEDGEWQIADGRQIGPGRRTSVLALCFSALLKPPERNSVTNQVGCRCWFKRLCCQRTNLSKSSVTILEKCFVHIHPKGVVLVALVAEDSR